MVTVRPKPAGRPGRGELDRGDTHLAASFAAEEEHPPGFADRLLPRRRFRLQPRAARRRPRGATGAPRRQRSDAAARRTLARRVPGGCDSTVPLTHPRRPVKGSPQAPHEAPSAPPPPRSPIPTHPPIPRPHLAGRGRTRAPRLAPPRADTRARPPPPPQHHRPGPAPPP